MNRFSFYGSSGDNKPNKEDDKKVEMAPLTAQPDEDDTTKNVHQQQQQQQPMKQQQQQPRYNIKVREDSNLNMILGNAPAPDCSTFCAFLCAYITYTCHYAPKLCWTLAAIALFIPSYLLLVGVVFNPTEHFGVIEHDFTNVQSQYDFAIKDISHWCIKGDSDSCDECEDPLQPEPRTEYPAWSKSHIGNIQQITDLMEEDLPNPDIAFLGGSIVEKMDGKWFGSKADNRLKAMAKIFNQHFTNLEGEATGDESLTAIALGIVGDTSPAVLYRLLNGEMPNDFDPKIWWLELGMNDLGRAQCSEEVVVLGILRVVEEIMNTKPDAFIVINSMFPMAELRDQLDPHQQDAGLAESFGEKPKKQNNNKNNKNQNKNKNKNNNEDKNKNNNEDKDKNKNNNEDKNKNSNRGKTRGLQRINKEIPLASKEEIQTDMRASSTSVRRVLPTNPKMNGNQKSQKKFNPVTHKERKLPLWTSIMAINKELAKFSEKHKNVFFFDVTRLFTERDGKFYNLKIDLITATGIPTEAGYDIWETNVATKAREILSGGDE